MNPKPEMSIFPTLIKPPPPDPTKSAIEGNLELTHLSPIDPDLFTNTQPLWRPPLARGLFGGCVISQCLAAAYKTVTSDFNVHSMHCYFVLAGNSEIPIIYKVERIRTGRSFATRTVQARQLGKVIFTTTVSFSRKGSGGKDRISHTTPMPFVPGPEDDRTAHFIMSQDSPIVAKHIDIQNNDSPYPHSKKTRQWVKTTGTISSEGGREAHLAALAYMSDHFLLGTISRVHKLWKIPVARDQHKEVKVDEDVDESLRDSDESKPKPVVTMMVSLDHTIYFHDPENFRADQWMFSETRSPWSDDGRGLVTSRYYQSGRLIATCMQEGVIRIRQSEAEAKL